MNGPTTPGLMPVRPSTDLWCGSQPLILASASTTRRELLESAGLHCLCVPAAVDERQLEKQALAQGQDALQLAIRLAEAKAREVAARYPDEIVIGADQTLAHDGEILHKPVDMPGLARQIARLSGSVHQLHAGVAIVSGDSCLARFSDTATLHMRPLTPGQIERYCALVGEDACTSVGGYKLEGAGIHLFEAIDGAHATILGLPLLPLLDHLRQLGKLAL
jgi:septum formation protein